MSSAVCDVYCDTGSGAPYCCPYGARCGGGCVCSWLYWGPGPCDVTTKAWLLMGMVSFGVLATVLAWLALRTRKNIEAPQMAASPPRTFRLWVHKREPPPPYAETPA
jgi:hypothetical protein